MSTPLLSLLSLSLLAAFQFLARLTSSLASCRPHTHRPPLLADATAQMCATLTAVNPCHAQCVRHVASWAPVRNNTLTGDERERSCGQRSRSEETQSRMVRTEESQMKASIVRVRANHMLRGLGAVTDDS